ncbi:phage baseplate assembly protein domain-containing protein [Magnetococcus sp. PR-3]|uniref:phage baseplate assembly protein domain-containing protein n=1 Tax=Magnetococcus sp. PR-3 TaxID=3120355 RepID=UPI002FCDF322
MHKVMLDTGSLRIEGDWDAVNIQRGHDLLAGGAVLICPDRWTLDDLQPPVTVGGEAQVFVDGVPMIDGRILSVQRRYQDPETGPQLVITCRDRSGDLMDHTVAPEQWQDADLDSVARWIAQPFGVVCSVPEGVKVRHFRALLGETAATALLRLARLFGLHLIPAPSGHLQMVDLLPSSRAGVDAVWGENLITYSEIQRHHGVGRITAHSQDVGRGWPQADHHLHGRGQVTLGDGHSRDLITVNQAGPNALSRAHLLGTALAGEAQQAEITLMDWGWPTGLWNPGHLLQLDLSGGGKATTNWRVLGITQHWDREGHRTILRLIDPAATAPLGAAVAERDTHSAVRGVVQSTRYQHGLLLAIVQLRHGEVVEVEMMQQTHVQSHPTAGSEVLVVAIAGDGGHQVAIADQERRRVSAIKPGEVMVHGPYTDRVHLAKDGIKVYAGSIQVFSSTIQLGSGSNLQPVARVGDSVDCPCGTGTIATGSTIAECS